MDEAKGGAETDCCGICFCLDCLVTGVGKLISCICCFIFAGAAAVLLWNFAFRVADDFDLGDFTDVLDNLTGIDWVDIGFDEDPYVGDNTTNEWRSPSGQPLELDIWNALDSTWLQEFQESVADWEDSEALILTTEQVDVDRKCTPVEGVMKVCNANYGDTGWVGINEVEITTQTGGSTTRSQGYISSSVAKMNEYYLRNADYPKRLYTMCHELGHGFGLPHTDENPNNADLGNCLDYTNTPENNLRPGEMNFARLRQMYLNRNSNNNNDGGGGGSNNDNNEQQTQNDGSGGDDTTTNSGFQVVEDQLFDGPDRRQLRRVRFRGYLHAVDLGLL